LELLRCLYLIWFNIRQAVVIPAILARKIWWIPFFFFASLGRNTVKLLRLTSVLKTKTLPLKAKTLKEIANELGLSPSTFYRKRKKKNLVVPKGVVTPWWQKVIYEALWYPDKVTKNELTNLKVYQ
jgi:AraC-like DNA-binding protein